MIESNYIIDDCYYCFIQKKRGASLLNQYCLLLLIIIAIDVISIINYHIGSKNNVVMLISKSIIEEFEYNIICDSTLFYFSTIYFTNYSLRAKKLLYTFLGSIFAVYLIPISIVRILTGLCFVGAPPPLSGGFRLGYFHAYRVRPVSTSGHIYTLF